MRGCGSRQRDDEFREYAGFGVNVNSAAMLFHDDVVAHRQPKPGAFAGRLGREERIEYFFLNLWWDTDAVVTDADFDVVAIPACAGDEFGFEAGAASLGRPFAHGIKAIGYQVEQHPRDLLRKYLYGAGVGIEIAAKLNIEHRFLGAGAMI